MAAAWAARVFSGDLSTDSLLREQNAGVWTRPPALAWVPAGHVQSSHSGYYTD